MGMAAAMMVLMGASVMRARMSAMIVLPHGMASRNSWFMGVFFVQAVRGALGIRHQVQLYGSDLPVTTLAARRALSGFLIICD